MIAVGCSGTAGGELAIGVKMAMGSPALLMATSLSGCFISLVLCCEVSLTSLDESPLTNFIFSPPFQEGTSHATPVKLFTENGLRCHRRQGAPVLSRARRPALMALSAAFGPSREGLVAVAGFALWSMVPSSLLNISLGREERTGRPTV